MKNHVIVFMLKNVFLFIFFVVCLLLVLIFIIHDFFLPFYD